MAARLIFGQCDCCAVKNRVLHQGEVTGIETYACATCSNGDLEDDADDIQAEIERLRPTAETGKQWARLCALEAALIEAREAETKRLNKRVTNLTYALERVKHGAEYCDELGDIINTALAQPAA